MTKSIIIIITIMVGFLIIIESKANRMSSLTRDDCSELYQMIGDNNDLLQKLRLHQQKHHHQHHQPSDFNDLNYYNPRNQINFSDSLMRLYDICIRSEEGIRYRRSLLWSPSSYLRQKLSKKLTKIHPKSSSSLLLFDDNSMNDNDNNNIIDTNSNNISGNDNDQN